jgi:hypothetical protein
MRWTLALLLAIAAVPAIAACHSDPDPVHPAPGELPPLPPASGTPIGYLLDAANDLKLRPDQVDHLKEIDRSLAAQDAEVDTQLRQIEHPEQDEQVSPQEMKAGKKAGRHNNAPGAMTVSNADGAKLHKLRDTQDKDAVRKAWGLLDPDQQPPARKILEDHGIAIPGAKTKQDTSSEDGTPVPGIEP